MSTPQALWIEDALFAVKAIAYAQRELTSEDVSDQLGRAPEPRALGAVMRVAADRKWITPTERFVPATHPSRHRAPIRTWASNLYIEEQAA